MTALQTLVVALRTDVKSSSAPSRTSKQSKKLLPTTWEWVMNLSRLDSGGCWKSINFTCSCFTCSKNLRVRLADMLKETEFDVVPRHGLSIVGQHTPKLERALKEVDTSHQMLNPKIEDILQNTTVLYLISADSNDSITAEKIIAEKLRRLFKCFMENDKYNVSEEMIRAFLRRREHIISMITQLEFQELSEICSVVGERLTKEH